MAHKTCPTITRKIAIMLKRLYVRLCLGKNQHSLNRSQTSHTNASIQTCHNYKCTCMSLYMRIYVWFYVALFVITGCHQAFHRHIQHQTNLLTSILTNSRTIHRQPYYRNIPISTKHKASTHSIPTIPFHSATQVKLMLQALLRPLPQQLPPPLLPCCC